MGLLWRAARPRDFAACARLLHGRLAYDARLVERMPDAWRRLHEDGALIAAVVEDPERTTQAPILGFGASVFVDEGFAREASGTREPYLGARVIRGELAGASPVLRLPAIRRANATDGLNVLIIHYAETTHPLDQETRRLLRFKMFEAFIASHRGWRIKQILQEFWDEIEPEYVVNGWGRVRSDYADWFRRRGLQLPPAGKGPLLIGLTREEALGVPGGPATSLFVHAPPRFHFTPAEQRLLDEALGGATDAQLADVLGLAPSTVKARWRTIYDRVAEVASELTLAAADPEPPGRGPEKRRRLLAYLRQHPEELRPTLPRRR